MVEADLGLTDRIIGAGLKVFLILVIVFCADLALVLIFKVSVPLLLGAPVSFKGIDDMFLPGFIAGTGLRVLKLVFGLVDLVVSCAGIIIGLVFPTGITVQDIIDASGAVIADLVLLISVDIVGFTSKYVIGLTADTVLRVAAGILGFLSPEQFKESYRDFTVNLVSVLTWFAIGGASYYLVDTAKAAFDTYADTSGNLKGGQITNIRSGDTLVNKKDILVEGEEQAVNPETGIPYYDPVTGLSPKVKTYGFKDAYAKLRWEKIWRNQEKVPVRRVETVPSDSGDRPVTLVYNEEVDYFAQSEKDGLLAKIKAGVQTNVESFLKGWKRKILGD